MMQHPTCLYCGKAFLTSSLTCGCEQSKLKVVYNDDIKPIYKDDLLSLASQLPKVPNIDHEKLVLSKFKEGGWLEVNKYILFVYRLHLALNPNKSLRGRIILFVSKCITQVRKWVRKHLNNLNTTI